MRIGIDGRWYYSGPPGNHVYLRNLPNALLNLPSKHQYFLFLPEAHRQEELGFAATVEPIYIPYRNSFLSNTFVLPKWRRRLNLDLFYLHMFPALFDRTSLFFSVLDVLFLIHPEYFSLPERLYFKFTVAGCRRADIIFTLSEFQRNRIAALRLAPAERVLVTPCAVDHETFRPEKNEKSRLELEERLSLRDRYVLYLGRLNERKNLARLVKAFSIIAPDYGGKLVLAGKRDWKMSDIQKLITESDLVDRVLLPGFVPDELLPVLYSHADAFVYVPVGEGFGIPPLEALASGVPVVVSNTTSLPEVVGDAALLVDPCDVEAIADGLKRVLTDDDMARSLREKGPERAKTFSWKKSAEVVLSALDDFS